VDVPHLWPEFAREGTVVLDGQRVQIGGRVFGFVGGGLRSPMRSGHEIGDEEYAAKIEAVGEVDVLCTHIPPDVPELLYDTVARRFERGSRALLDAIRRTRPRYALFGHVHQPLVRRMRIGATECVNVGHFARTGTPWVLEW
jgi:Icc-related predicted phosphoesterase